jgi:hypothetical protein
MINPGDSQWQLYELSKRILTLAWIEPGQTHQWKWNNAKPVKQFGLPKQYSTLNGLALNSLRRYLIIAKICKAQVTNRKLA